MPEQYRQFDLQDKVVVTGVTTTLIYLYVVPARAEGTWSARLPARLSKEPVRLSLKQQITRVSGSAHVTGKDVALDNATLRGERITFRLAFGGKPYDFAGSIRGSSIEGTVEGDGLKAAAWSAAPGR